jgi:G:T-mismatch repair DNA endonuclease (very short patch repair protein)
MKTTQAHRNQSKKYRETHSNLIDLECKLCGKPRKIKAYLKTKYIKRGGVTCRDCRSLISSNVLKELRENQTPEERQEHGRNARKSVKDPSMAVKKQWQTIKKDDSKFALLKKQRSEQGKKNWESFDEEKKNRIVVAMLSSKGNVRSLVCDDFKKSLVAKGITGFVSEQPFHGFIPDEINHDLKIIIEVFGDVYHCNPDKYKDPNQFVKVIERTVGEQWKRDEIKIAAYKRNGYKTIVVWEKDFRNDPNGTTETVIRKIKS